MTGPQGQTIRLISSGPPGVRGSDGIGYATATINDAGHLVLTKTDASVIDLGRVIGDDGQPGPAGQKGDRGEAGLTGPQGLQGPKGDIGAKGSTGADSVVPGPKGDMGPAGSQGLKGDKGDRGEPGLNLAVVAVSTGSADAGKVVALNESGRIDLTLLNGTQEYSLLGPTVFSREGRQDLHSATYPPVLTSDSTYRPIWQFTEVDNATGGSGPQPRTYMNYHMFGDSQKGMGRGHVRSRGNGVPGDPGYYKASKAGDRLILDYYYGSNNYCASHIGYMFWAADTDCTDNELPATFSLKMSNGLGRGNGFKVNARSQINFPGPNQDEPLSGQLLNYGANITVGAGASEPNGAPLKLTPGPLLTVPEPYAEELGPDGIRYYTDAAAKRLPYHRATRIVAASAVKKSYVATASDANTVVTLTSITVPGGCMGPNGFLEISFTLTCSGNANSKSFAFRARSTGLNMAKINMVSASTTAVDSTHRWHNRGVTSAQVAPGGRTDGGNSTTVITNSVDTTADFIVDVIATASAAGDTITLESYAVKAIYGA